MPRRITNQSKAASAEGNYARAKLRYRRFAEAYIINFNKKQAAIVAGYSPKTAHAKGHALFKREDVQQMIADEAAKRARRTKVDQDYVVNKLREVVEKALQETPVLDRHGTPTGLFKFDGTAVNAALKLLGYHLQMWKDPTKTIIFKDLRDLTPDELKKQIGDVEREIESIEGSALEGVKPAGTA